jgi:hypothetical protein
MAGVASPFSSNAICWISDTKLMDDTLNNRYVLDRSTPTCATQTSMTSSTQSLTWMLM